jgi:hypothetical protein
VLKVTSIYAHIMELHILHLKKLAMHEAFLVMTRSGIMPLMRLLARLLQSTKTTLCYNAFIL